MARAEVQREESEMIIVPVRVVDRTDGGVLCRLGSEPYEDAPVELVPKECIVRASIMQGTDLGVLVVDPKKAPEGIRKALGLG